MTVATLDAEKLYFATLAGCHAVVRERETLNAINVFPVQDGDTGDNMTATASAVIHHAALEGSVKETLQSVANASMTGARGNSGMIFSQFFNALADGAPEHDALNIHHFTALLHHAATRVRAAILNPMDGTMLTIMESWSKYMAEHAVTISCFKTILQTITLQLQEAVAQTTQTLAVLKHADVVDAGALGFFHFINGFTSFIADPSSLPTHHSSMPTLTFNDHPDECASEHPKNGRYCTEALLKSQALNADALMQLLKQYGESVVLTANSQMCRFHLHTDRPWDVFHAVQTMGQIQQPKIDDMLRQYQTLHDRTHSIALVTDTTADLPWSFCDQHQIHQLPINLHINGHDLIDKYSVSTTDFYEQQRHHVIKTSCPSPLWIEQKVKPIAAQYDHVVILSIAQNLSGTHDAIKLATEKYPNVHVINTNQCSAGHGLLLTAVAEQLATKPDMTIEALLQYIQTTTTRVHFWFTIHDLHALIQSGRINKILGKMAQLSGMKPLFSFGKDGKVHLSGQAFSESAALQKLIHAAEHHCQSGRPLQQYCVVHSNAPDLAATFATLCTTAFGKPPAYIEQASSAIGTHAGTGCVGLAILA